MTNTSSPFPTGYSKREGSDMIAKDIVTAKKSYTQDQYVYGTVARKYFELGGAELTITDASITADTVPVVSYPGGANAMSAAHHARCSAQAAGSMTFEVYDKDGAVVDQSGSTKKFAVTLENPSTKAPSA